MRHIVPYKAEICVRPPYNYDVYLREDGHSVSLAPDYEPYSCLGQLSQRTSRSSFLSPHFFHPESGTVI